MPRQPRPLRVEPLEDRLTPAAAGDLDPTFGTGGVVSFGAGLINLVAALPDGRSFLLTQSSFPSLERLKPDGTPDPTFGSGGFLSLPTGSPLLVAALIALPDGGALVVMQQSTAGSGFSSQVFRVTPTGAVDPTFGTGGSTALAFGVVAGAVLPDGRTVLVGSQAQTVTLDGANIGTGTMDVARLTDGGQLDPTFGTGGQTTVSFPVQQFDQAAARSVAVQPDGRIVVGGEATVSGSLQTNNSVSFWSVQFGPVAARLTADGQLDPTFGTGGRVVVTFPQETNSLHGFVGAGVQADGRVLLAGDVITATGAEGGAARLTPTGQLDPTYGTGGLAVTAPFIAGPNPQPLMKAAVDPLDRVVFSTNGLTVPGSRFTNDDVFRLTASGFADPRFGTGGRVNLSTLPGLNLVPDASNLQAGLAVQADGSILMAGPVVLTSNSTTNGLLIRLIGNAAPPGFVSPATGSVVAGGAADGTFQTLSPSGGTFGTAGTITAFPGSAANVRGTTADVNGDGVPDYVTGAGPGSAPEVTVFDGKTGLLLADFLAFEPSFTGGVFVAAADLDGDGKAELVVTPDQGGGPRVVIFSVVGGTTVPRASFFGIADPNFRGGARAAVGNLNGDGTPDLAVAAGFLGGPRVALWDGKTVLSGSPTELVNDFFAFPGADATTLRNGVYVAIGDLTGSGPDLIFGGGPGGAPRVFVLNGQQVAGGDVAGAQAAPIANFFVAGNSADRGGVRVAVTPEGGSGASDLVVGSGQGDPGRVRVYTGGLGGPGEPSTFQDVGVFGGVPLPDGVYVG